MLKTFRRIFQRKTHRKVCVSCKTDHVQEWDFKDELSREEFAINGTCQSCQDQMYG